MGINSFYGLSSPARWPGLASSGRSGARHQNQARTAKASASMAATVRINFAVVLI
jgi:hypothetical protein